MKCKVFLLFLFASFCLCMCSAEAGWWSSTDYKELTSQTEDVSTDTISVTINGVVKTVPNLYNAAEKASDPSSYSNGSKYCCAAYVWKFYNDVFGIKVSNLLSPNHKPLVNSGSGYFSEVSTPQIGDIVRVNTQTHWGIVKSVADNGVVTIIQQNAGYFDDNGIYKAMLNTKVNPPYNTVSFFRWSEAPVLGPVQIANLGNDFYAVILNTKHWKPISQKADTSRIYLESEDGSSKQVWRFIRQEDGSYVISSCYNGKVLEMTDGIREICTQITAQGEDWGGAYQRWYLIRYGDGLIFKSKHYSGENWVMDNHGGFDQDDNVIQINTRNNTTAQIWSVYSADDVQLKGPTLNIVPGDSASETHFEWTRSYGASCYNLRIFKDTVWTGEDYSSWNLSSLNCSKNLPAGTYYAYVDAVNYHKYVAGAIVSFVVAEGQDPITEHKLTEHPKVPPTCTLPGTEAYWSCSECGELFSDKDGENMITKPVEIKPLGHQWTRVNYKWDDHNAWVTASRCCTRNEQHNETETAHVIITVITPSQETAGALVYSATFENPAFSIQKKIITIPALNDMDVLYLPVQLKVIEEKAFTGIASEAVIIPEGCERINSEAFARCVNLKYVWIPKTVKYIEENAFDMTDSLIIDYETDH